jgi:hypothetical protein
LIIAELKGKIPSALQNYEDILTSSVIGLFQYLSSPVYFQTVLESCVNVNGAPLTFEYPIHECQYVFWPKLESSEPDVLLHLRTKNESEYLICIEAKYWSDKSSNEDQSIDMQERSNSQRDQLAREIEDIHKEFYLRFFKINKNKLKKIILIYLTNHTYLPSQEIHDSVQHINGVDFPINQLYWLTWREIHHSVTKERQDAMLLSDLKSLLEKKGLQSFNGFQHQVINVTGLIFTYSTSLNSYSWDDMKGVHKSNWKYGGAQNGK